MNDDRIFNQNLMMYSHIINIPFQQMDFKSLHLVHDLTRGTLKAENGADSYLQGTPVGFLLPHKNFTNCCQRYYQ